MSLRRSSIPRSKTRPKESTSASQHSDPYACALESEGPSVDQKPKDRAFTTSCSPEINKHEPGEPDLMHWQPTKIALQVVDSSGRRCRDHYYLIGSHCPVSGYALTAEVICVDEEWIPVAREIPGTKGEADQPRSGLDLPLVRRKVIRRGGRR